MGKYSQEFKLKVICEYLNGGDGYWRLASKYQIPSVTSIRLWVDAYKAHGAKGLVHEEGYKKYSSEFKQKVVKLYLQTGTSYRDLSCQLGIKSPTSVEYWVAKYKRDGLSGLCEPNGRHCAMKTGKKQKSVQTPPQAEYVKELEQKVLYLEIENEYLKELRSLHQEKKKKSQE